MLSIPDQTTARAEKVDTGAPSCSEGPVYRPWLFRYALVMGFVTTFLLYAGGFTTSIEAGMAFLDWPLSNGSINPPGWTSERDQLAEHGHRLIGFSVGMLCLALFLWAMTWESRRWVRRLAGFILVMVVLQGLLGGLRVLLDVQNMDWDHNVVALSFAVTHGVLGQVFFCSLVGMAVILSPGWVKTGFGWQGAISPQIRVWGWLAIGALLMQLLLGAVMRHGRFSAIIPTFPAAAPDGSWLPAFVNWQTVLQFTHTRIGPILATVAIVFFATLLIRATRSRLIRGLSISLLVLLVLQISLGILTILKMINEHAATFHMLFGAFLMANAFALLVMAYHPVARGRSLFGGRTVPGVDPGNLEPSPVR